MIQVMNEDMFTQSVGHFQIECHSHMSPYFAVHFYLKYASVFLCHPVHSGKLGALRLKVRLVEDRILPSVYYLPLIDLLVESVISPAEVSIINLSTY